MKKIAALLVLLALLAVNIAYAQDDDNPTECIAEGEFNPEQDYFPQKVTVEYATGFTVEYFNSYKVITVTAPFPGAEADDAVTYVLVQCGAPTPDGYANALVTTVPVNSVIALSTTYLPHLRELDVLDHLVGVDTMAFVNTPEVLALSDAGALVEVGNGADVNVEVVLDTAPDLVMSYASGSPEFDTHPVLLDAGVFTAIAADYVESHPLGRAEWLKFTALFFNAEGAAQKSFTDKAQVYNGLMALTAELPVEEQPLILWDSYTSYGSGAWYIPGQNSYVAQLIQDAGARYVLQDAAEVQGISSSVPFSFEAVYEVGLMADIWIPGSFGINTLDDLLGQDERYADFAALTNGRVFTLGARLNANGGDDYYENGVTNPQLVLADLIAIFHPELLPDHELYFFRWLAD